MHSHVGWAWTELLNSIWSLLVNPQSQIPSIHSRKTPDLENQVVHSNWLDTKDLGKATHKVFHYLLLLTSQQQYPVNSDQTKKSLLIGNRFFDISIQLKMIPS